MKKICFFLEKINASGGIPRVVSIIANGLCSRGYNVEILSLTNIDDKNEKYNLNNKIIVNYLFENRSLNYKRNFLKIHKAIKKYFILKKYDTVIVAGMDFVPFFFNKIRNTQMIAWEHSNYSIGSKLGFRYWGRRIACKKFDKVIVLTDKDMKLYKKSIKNIKAEIIRIYNPIENKEIESVYNKNSKILLSCGALIKQKGFDYAIKVAEIVFKENKDWKWLIYGNGNEQENLEKLIEKKGLKEQVLLKNYTDNIIEVYKTGSIFILPSRFEGFCMVNLEAMYMKLPVVAFDFNCGPDEIILNGVNGFIINDFNIKEMAKKIDFLIKNTDKRIQMSMNTFKSLFKFEINKILNEWEEIIRR